MTSHSSLLWLFHSLCRAFCCVPFSLGTEGHVLKQQSLSVCVSHRDISFWALHSTLIACLCLIFSGFHTSCGHLAAICWQFSDFILLFVYIVCLFQVECYDHNNSGSHEIIGSFQTTLSQIQQATQSYAVSSVLCLLVFLASNIRNTFNLSILSHVCSSQAEFECINSKKKEKKKGYKNSGVIIIKQCKVLSFYVFLFDQATCKVKNKACRQD